MNKELEEKCKRLLNSHSKEIKADERFYSLKDICYKEYADKKLVVPVGRMDDGEPIYMDMTWISGLFIGGATGTGKSIFIDDFVVSLILKNSYDEVKFINFDPKKVELGEYDGIKYLFGKKKNTSSSKKGINLLTDIFDEISERVEVLKISGQEDIRKYNEFMTKKWPHIFIIIDEGSPIFNMENGQELLEQILSMGKVVGFHLIFATNDYLKNYGYFIDKFEYRMTFDMASKEQSSLMRFRSAHLLKDSGESLIKGKKGIVYKFQAPFISDKEIQNVVLEIGKGEKIVE